MINGKRYSWEDSSIALPHGTLVDVQDVSWNDEKEFREVYGKGGKPVGYGSGNYKAEAKLTLLWEEWMKVVSYCQAQGLPDVYSLPPFPITVSWRNEDEPLTSVTLQQCKLKKTSSGTKQNDEKTEVSLDLAVFGGVKYGDMQASAMDALKDLVGQGLDALGGAFGL